MRIKEAMCLFETVFALIHNSFLFNYIEFIVISSFQMQFKKYPKIILNSVGPKIFVEWVQNLSQICSHPTENDTKMVLIH
jgi:hypothetical protein